MAVRSVVTIDVDDSAFRRFSELFAQYQNRVNEIPGAWRKIGDEVDGVLDKTASSAEKTSVSFRQTFIAVSNSAAQLSKVTTATSAAGRFASAQAHAWRGLARDARSFAAHIGEATRSLLRWSALTGVLSGILGSGGLFGIERLATSAANQRRSASGLGVTPGEESAFNINYGRLVDSQSVLHGVSSALLDPQKRVALYGAGLSEGDIQGKDAAQVAVSALESVKRLVDQTPREQLGSLVQARRLGDLGLNEQDLQRIRDRPASELAEYHKRFDQDSKNNNLTNDQQEAWEKFKTQLTRAGESIENAFIKGLTPLAPALESLSAAFTHAISVFLENPRVAEWLKALAGALERFAGYVATPEFDTKIVKFVEDVGKLATAIGEAFTAVVDWVKWFRGGANGEGDPTADPSTATTGRGDLTNPDDARVPGSPAWRALREQQGHPSSSGWTGTTGNLLDRGDASVPGSDAWRDARRRQQWLQGIEPSNAAPLTPEQRAALYPQLEQANQLPLGLLSAVEKQESGFKDATSAAGAKGYFQFTDATAKRFGVNVDNEGSSAWGAAHYLKENLQRFQGDVPKALAGYNWGEGNVERDVKQFGDKWREHLPDETSKYVSSIERMMKSSAAAGNTQTNVKLQVYNATAGNAVLAASQLPI